MWRFFLFHFVFVVSQNVEVFLDHGGHSYHAEVFYSVANHVLELYPVNNITFVMEVGFAKEEGLVELFHKYGATGPINPFYYRFEEMFWYKPLAGREFKKLICNKDNTKSKYWLRVIVTIANLNGVDKCLLSYANSSKYMFIIHHPTKRSGGGGFDGSIISWNNSYIASNATIISDLSPRHFSPSLMPLLPGRPNCHTPPVFIVQGDPERRNFVEIDWLLETNYSFTVRIMNRVLLRKFSDSRVEYLENISLLKFHELFLDAAFILPLISPSYGKTRSYFYGRSTSSIAFGTHFRLRFLSHIAVESTFHYEFKSFIHYWHDGRKSSFLKVLKVALAAFDHWCFQNDGSSWA